MCESGVRVMKTNCEPVKNGGGVMFVNNSSSTTR